MIKCQCPKGPRPWLSALATYLADGAPVPPPPLVALRHLPCLCQAGTTQQQILPWTGISDLTRALERGQAWEVESPGFKFQLFPNVTRHLPEL